MKKYIISELRLKELLEKEDELDLLYNANVDKWEGYKKAFEGQENINIEEYINENFYEVER